MNCVLICFDTSLHCILKKYFVWGFSTFGLHVKLPNSKSPSSFFSPTRVDFKEREHRLESCSTSCKLWTMLMLRIWPGPGTWRRRQKLGLVYGYARASQHQVRVYVYVRMFFTLQTAAYNLSGINLRDARRRRWTPLSMRSGVWYLSWYSHTHLDSFVPLQCPDCLCSQSEDRLHETWKWRHMSSSPGTSFPASLSLPLPSTAW